MSLEAALDDAETVPDREDVLAFVARVDASLAAIATALRSGTVPNVERLRAAERALNERLVAAQRSEMTRDCAGAVADAFDRITDSVDTLAHLVRQRRHAVAAAKTAVV